jgi:hypothetical protein
MFLGINGVYSAEGMVQTSCVFFGKETVLRLLISVSGSKN